MTRKCILCGEDCYDIPIDSVLGICTELGAPEKRQEVLGVSEK